VSIDFGVPPLAADNRALVDERLKEVRAAGGVPETIKVELHRRHVNVEVIDMPLASLFYNPGTHRIRAQRSHDPERDAELTINPWSDSSQEYLHYLLTTVPSDPAKRDPRFDELKDSLKSFKQLEPGLITPDGILVNGNTRRAALKELGAATIRVGVLPASCTWADIHAVELSLQLRQDHRRDYSYINHLLAVEEQVTLGQLVSDIAREFHTTTSALDRDMWILSELKALIERSKNGTFALRLMDFEDHKEKLFELYRAYKAEKNSEKADLLKESRLAAIALGFAKTDVRFIGPDFQARFLDQRLPAGVKPAPATAPAVVSIPGINRVVPVAAPEVDAAAALTDAILKVRAVEVAGAKATPSEITNAAKRKDEIQGAFDEAIEFAGKDFRLRKKRQAAPDRVVDACKDLEQCVTDIVMARGNGSLDQEAFDDALVKLRGVMSRLATEAGKTIELPGEGVSWLRTAADTQL